MATLDDVKAKLRKTKWGFLAEMLGEVDHPQAMMGVNARGVLMVNPREAARLDTRTLVSFVRNEFIVANDLRREVPGFI